MTMALPFRPRAVPQCSACLRSYAFGRAAQTPTSALQQQIRGKKRMPNNSGTMVVRLLKNVRAYGRIGALVPTTPGTMRNIWFPGRIAAYVTVPEMKRLRQNNVSMERDFQYGVEAPIRKADESNESSGDWQKDIPADIQAMSNAELRQESAAEKARIEKGGAGKKKTTEVERVTPERGMELVNLFVPPRLEFYRQPIAEEKEVEKQPEVVRTQFKGAAGDLLASRPPMVDRSKQKPQGIYGSISSHDVLMAVRAAMAENDEAARVVLQESEIRLIDPATEDGAEAGKVKHVGDFVVEIRARGAEEVVQRTVRVLPQEVD